MGERFESIKSQSGARAMGITDDLLECRGVMKRLFGDRYDEVVEPTRILIRKAMKDKKESAAVVAIVLLETVFMGPKLSGEFMLRFLAAVADVTIESKSNGNRGNEGRDMG